jgi:hypothetical protein
MATICEISIGLGAIATIVTAANLYLNFRLKRENDNLRELNAKLLEYFNKEGVIC